MQCICMSYKNTSRCYRKPTSVDKCCLLRFQTSWFSGCLASLSRQEPLYCNLSKTVVLLSNTDHFICLKTSLQAKNTNLIFFQMPEGRILFVSLRANLYLSCTSAFWPLSKKCRDNVWSWVLVLNFNTWVPSSSRDSEQTLFWFPSRSWFLPCGSSLLNKAQFPRFLPV